MSLLLESFPVGPLGCNCSIVACTETKEAAIIDPGGDVDEIISRLKKHGLTAKYLLHTHAHLDHIMGSKGMREKTGALICLNKEDQFLYDKLTMQAGMFGFPAEDPLPVDRFLNDEEHFDIGDLRAYVIHRPGHTPGSCCFSLAEKESVLFSGDTLFNHSIGRTDLWGGSFEQIIDSISQRLFKLDDSTRVIAGHGPDTDIWSEKKENPFFN
jgi:glyoxylase-like metal-dependent hydrolase (beta-lactamase superfamily II)